MPRKATIDMVAKRAGVSRGTVDRVINERSYVKAEVKERIIAAIKELGYVPLRSEQAQRLGVTSALPEVIRLGVLLPNWTGNFKKEVLRGIEDAKRLLHNYHVEVLVEQAKTDLTDETIERLEALRAQKVNGIAMCAKDHESIVACIDSLVDDGIPVVTFNSDIAGSKRLCFVGQDLRQGGRIAGELMMKYLSPDDKLLVAVGNPEFNAHRERLQGFCERIKEHGFDERNMHLVQTNQDYFLTYEKISKVLSEESDIKGIYMANRSTTACVEVVRAYGRQGKLHIICHDITDVSKRLLQSGEIDFALAQNIYNQGYRPLIILREYIREPKAIENEFEKSNIEIICAENLMA